MSYDHIAGNDPQPPGVLTLAPPAGGKQRLYEAMALVVSPDEKPELRRALASRIAALPPVTQQVIALIPAHNEELTVAATIASLRAQDRAPDRIIVWADNCTDGTQRAAREAGAEVHASVANEHMKPGVLNQALGQLLSWLDPADIIMVVDADTEISPNFIRAAIARFAADPRLGGVSGVYEGRPGGGFVGWCQRNEFARWGFDARQQDGRAICLSGAASAFTVRALTAVASARRAGYLPGRSGVYSTGNFTEDFELTQALLHQRFRIANMMDVWIRTAVKPTWHDLHIQRLRWNRGITETLLQFGWTRHTRMMWVRWALYLLSVMAIPLSFFLIGYRLASGEGWHLNGWMWLWLSVTAVMMLHKSATLAGTRSWSALPALLLLPEMAYDSFLHLTFLRSLWLTVTGAHKTWR